MTVVAENDNVRILQLELNEWNTNAYIVICKVTGESMVVDAPGKVDEILRHLEGTQPLLITITHGHMDHIEVLAQLLSSRFSDKFCNKFKAAGRLYGCII